MMWQFLTALTCLFVVTVCQDQVYTIAFNAHRSTPADYAPSGIVVFDVNQTNIYRSADGVLGTPYNPSTGYFTCPVNGIYYFHYTIKSGSLAIFSGEILHIDTDGTTVLGVYAAGKTQEGLDTFSSSATFTCTTSQIVRVVANENGNVYAEEGKRYSVFGGLLVYGIFSQ